MEYFKINYSKLENLPQLKFYIFVLFNVVLIFILIIVAFFIKVNHITYTYGIYKDNILHIKINSKLSDVLKNDAEIIFNNENVNYSVISYEDYEVIDNNIYQEIKLSIDKSFYDNEIGMVKIYYHKESLIKYIFDLFK